MISSRKPVLRSTQLTDQTVQVPLRVDERHPVLRAAHGPEALRAAAEAEAQSIIAHAEAQREQILSDAWHEGFNSGQAEAHTRMMQAAGVTEHMIEAMATEVAKLPERMAPEVTAMALEVAARIVRAELSVRPERVVEIVRGAIRRTTDRERLVVHVNPEDIALVREAAPGYADQIGGISRLDVVDDPRIPRGGCVVESPAGDVDARLTTQFERMAEALREMPDDDLVAPANEEIA